MEKIAFKNCTGAGLQIVIEPIGENYFIEPGCEVELRGDLGLDNGKSLDIHLEKGFEGAELALVFFTSEETIVIKNGLAIAPPSPKVA